MKSQGTMVKNCNFNIFLIIYVLFSFLVKCFFFKRGEGRKNITLLTSMGPQYIIVGSWEFNLNMSLPMQLSSIPLL